MVGFKFVLSDKLEIVKKRSRPAEAPTSDQKSPKKFKADADADENKNLWCGICNDVVYQAVTASPCLHNVRSLCKHNLNSFVAVVILK